MLSKQNAKELKRERERELIHIQMKTVRKSFQTVSLCMVRVVSNWMIFIWKIKWTLAITGEMWSYVCALTTSQSQTTAWPLSRTWSVLLVDHKFSMSNLFFGSPIPLNSLVLFPLSLVWYWCTVAGEVLLLFSTSVRSSHTFDLYSKLMYLVYSLFTIYVRILDQTHDYLWSEFQNLLPFYCLFPSFS